MLALKNMGLGSCYETIRKPRKPPTSKMQKLSFYRWIPVSMGMIEKRYFLGFRTARHVLLFGKPLIPGGKVIAWSKQEEMESAMFTVYRMSHGESFAFSANFLDEIKRGLDGFLVEGETYGILKDGKPFRYGSGRVTCPSAMPTKA